MSRAKQQDLDTLRQLKRNAEQAKKLYSEAKQTYIQKHISINNQSVISATRDMVIETAEDFEKAGYTALIASVVFAPFTYKEANTKWTEKRTYNQHLSEQQASEVCERVMRNFDKLNGLKHGKRIARISAKHSGATDDNWHWHLTMFIDKDWDLDTVISKYKHALKTTKMRGAAGSYGNKNWYKQILIKESICEKVDDYGTSKWHALYTTHEVNKDAASIEIHA